MVADPQCISTRQLLGGLEPLAVHAEEHSVLDGSGFSKLVFPSACCSHPGSCHSGLGRSLAAPTERALVPLQIVLSRSPPVSSLTVLGTDLMASVSCGCGSPVLSPNLQGTVWSFLLTSSSQPWHVQLTLPRPSQPQPLQMSGYPARLTESTSRRFQ